MDILIALFGVVLLLGLIIFLIGMIGENDKDNKRTLTIGFVMCFVGLFLLIIIARGVI